MLLDLNTLASGSVLNVDLCIAGAGAAGIAIARQFMGSGLKVCLIESGGLQHEDASQALYSGTNVGRPMEMDVGRYRVLGGSTSRWTGRCAPLDRVDLAERAWVPHSGWPIRFETLAGYYPRAQVVCGFRDPWPKPKPQQEGSLVDNFNWHFPARMDRKSLHFGLAYRDDLVADRDTTVLLHANLAGFETAGSAEGARVVGVQVQSLAGIAATVRAREYVLCCGGIENARLLLNGAAALPGGFGNRHDQVGRYFMQHPRGETGAVLAPGPKAREMQHRFNVFTPKRGAQCEVGFALPEHVQRDQGLLNASAVLWYRARADAGWEASKRLARSLVRGRVGRATFRDARLLLKDPVDTVVNSWRRTVRKQNPHFLNPWTSVVVDLEQVPNPDSRVTLSDERDRFGWLKARTDWRIAELERQTARVMTELVGAELTRQGLGEVTPMSWLYQNGPLSDGDLTRTHHHIGTTRMSESARTGVVDANCRVHGMENLFVAGCSVFPTGGHANPTLTIVALAIRLADHLNGKLRQKTVALARIPALTP